RCSISLRYLPNPVLPDLSNSSAAALAPSGSTSEAASRNFSCGVLLEYTIDRARAIPAAATVSQNQRKILMNRFRIQVSRSANTFDSFAAVLETSDLLAKIADVRIDAAIERREFTS